MNLVAIVGRPNVGKSTLFNRLVGRRVAIVEDVPGVTRDRHYAQADWGDRRFTLVDTGGLDFDAVDEVGAQMRHQAQVAVEEADVILFVVDAHQGYLPADAEVARYLRGRAKDVVVVVNKVDGERWEPAGYDFHQAGFGEVVLVSAEHGRGMDGLVDAVEARIPAGESPAPTAEEAVRVAVLGRPNVGKSSLVNRLIGAERLVVSAVAGTTRDAIDSRVSVRGKEYLLIDTAGIRRRPRVEEGVERWSVLKALRAIDRAQICLVLLDATEGLTDQDARILNLVHRGRRGVIIGLNKWDAVEKDAKTFDRAVKEIRHRLGPLGHAPVVSLSALTGQRVPQIFDAVDRVYEEWHKRLSTSAVNDFLTRTLRELPPPVVGGKRARIYYMTQAQAAPPVFAAFSSFPDGLPVAYERFLVNRLRDAFGFEGVPLTIRVRQRTRSDERGGR